VTRARTLSVKGLMWGALLAFGCGKTTALGKVRPGEDGGGAVSGEGGGSPAGGASGDAGASGEGASGGATGEAGTTGGAGEGDASGGAASDGSASGGANGAGTAGTASAGAAGRGRGDAASTDAGPVCRPPKPTPIANPTPADLERARLIHDYCVALARDDCWNTSSGTKIWEQVQGCSLEERIVACEQDVLYGYVTLVAQWAPTCDDEWQAAIRCSAAAEHTECSGAGWLRSAPACHTEAQTLSNCIGSDGTGPLVTGSRTTCSYGIGRFAQCTVSCLDTGNHFNMNCDGPAGLPLNCNCTANFRDVSVRNWDNNVFYASNCQEAAQAAADGVWCTNRLDCCIERVSNGTKVCACGSDNGLCEARARETSVVDGPGTIVPICPQYVRP
jgi:hypothetical protein